MLATRLKRAGKFLLARLCQFACFAIVVLLPVAEVLLALALIFVVPFLLLSAAC